MSWQLGSFLVLGAALVVGFAWYERSRPPSRVLALVVALAALAVVARVAFAPIPNVKPTTDIVLFAGYALGGAPGFAVGAVTALVSNIFFSQGPWTPWQMAGWGGVGIMGAVLARVAGGRELGRLALAIPCGLAGLAFGVVLDVYQWTLAAEQTAASFVAVSAASFGYNVAHIVGNVAFCLLFGPPFVRALLRYRRRFEVRWVAPRPAGTAVSVVVLGSVSLLVSLAMVAPSPSAAASASDRAVRFLERAQNSDGGFGGGTRQASNQLHTGWAALGLAAAGRNPGDVRKRKPSIIEYIRTHAEDLKDTGSLERTILVLRASGVSPRRFARRDLVAELAGRRSRDGSFEGASNLTAFAILALRAGGQSIRSAHIRRAAGWLERQQNEDGGFGFGRRGVASDVDDTGAALQALATAGQRGAAMRRAIGYLRRAQNADGGFGQMRDSGSNAQSTAWAVQGLLAARRDPDRLRRGGRSPLAFLRSLQTRDGRVRYSRTSAQTPVWVTAQALMALKRKPFPIDPVPREHKVRAAETTAPARGGRARRRGTSGPTRRRTKGGAAKASRRRPEDAVAKRDVAGAAGAAASLPADSRGAPRSDPEPPTVGAGLAAAAAALLLGGLWRRRRARAAG